MILLLGSSSSICKLTLMDSDGQRHDYEWEAGRGLAKGLLGYIKDRLDENSLSWYDISAIGVFKGPGSFTGLRIGITVLNTIADAQNIPIVGCLGEDWQEQAISRLKSGGNDNVVLPFYGREANITRPKK